MRAINCVGGWLDGGGGGDMDRMLLLLLLLTAFGKKLSIWHEPYAIVFFFGSLGWVGVDGGLLRACVRFCVCV